MSFSNGHSNGSNSKTAAISDVTMSGLKTIKSSKDANGIFTTVTYRRKTDNSLFATAVLSGGTSPKYTTRTITYYQADGTTVIKTVPFTLTYDTDGTLISEV